MPSLIPDYEYDIFISYRQKDNKGDHWVTEFVQALKTELESTFKEEISVYFDENPSDGLLDTDDVDGTLKEKLKCLVFIPIISRTYCDSNSFAWEQEFKAFVEMASQDRFGLRIRQHNGNMASRVLPVLIHDLDQEDILLCESVLGGALRGVKFVYHYQGVNRPLRQKDDDVAQSSHQLIYRDQINKVANALREVISGMRNPEHGRIENAGISETEAPLRRNLPALKIAGISLVIIGLILIILLGLTDIFSTGRKTEKSIAVLPFHNYSEDQRQEYMSDGLTDEIINHLYKIESFDRVVSLSSVMTYKGSDKKIPAIASELKVNYILDGSYKKIGDEVRVNAQLIDPKSDKPIWQRNYDKPYSEILSIQADIALQIANQVNAYLSGAELEKIRKVPTVKPEAYDLYQQGRYLWNKRTREDLLKSISLFEKSVSIDPDYAAAYAGLADAYCILVFWDWFPRNEGYSKSKEYALKARQLDPDLAEAHAILGSVYLWGDWSWKEARKELELAIGLNPKNAVAHQYYSEYLDIIRNNSAAREQINIALELDPVSSAIRGTSALYYCNDGKFQECLEECLKTIEFNPEYLKVYPLCFYSYLKLGYELKAVEIFQKFLRLDSTSARYADGLSAIYDKAGINGVLNWIVQAELMKPHPSEITLAWAYSVIGNRDESIKWLENAFKTLPADLPRINSYIIFNDLRSDPRFLELVRKMGLDV